MEVQVNGVQVYVLAPLMDEDGHVTWTHYRSEDGSKVDEEALRLAIREKIYSR